MVCIWSSYPYGASVLGGASAGSVAKAFTDDTGPYQIVVNLAAETKLGGTPEVSSSLCAAVLLGARG